MTSSDIDSDRLKTVRAVVVLQTMPAIDQQEVLSHTGPISTHHGFRILDGNNK